MSRPPLVRLSTALPLLALLACKLGKDDEQSARPLPAPEPASTTPPSRPVEADPPRERPKDPAPRPPSDVAPASPKPATPAPTATATATTTSTSTATATADAGAPAASDAGAPAAGGDKLNQCIAKCQGSLSACLSKPVPFDAGVPSLESMSECKKAFEDCRAACSP